MDHYDHSKKNSEVLSFFLTLSSLNLTHMQTKTLLHFLLYFFHFNVKSTSYKSKTNLTPLQTLRDKASSVVFIKFPSLATWHLSNMAPLIMALLHQLEDNFTSWHHPRHRRQHQHGTARHHRHHPPRDRRLHHLQLLQRRHHSFTCIEKIRLRTSDSASAEDSWTDSVTSVPSDCLRQLSPESRSFSKCETRIGIGF